ncbi:prenyltransferase [Nocardiopsis trehalosi]|uniref:prenyltransferase n=1 Tax=Nocardiopsis trehalosi TaxID=109329 RepID=UPI000835C9DD|nr:prenyltransferase [Nocardiopsis trehalosi]
MTMVTSEALRTAEHFISRNARLLDRLRFAYHFQSGPTGPVLTALDCYRNIDGGYGNGLDPDLRGHGSQPLAVETALRLLDELGPLPRDTAASACRYLTGVARPDGGVPPVLPSARHTDAAPQWHDADDFTGALRPTAALAGLLHKHHACGPWRDRATAFSWTRIGALHWTDPEEAIAVCTFLQHVPDRPRADAELTRLRPMIRAVIDLDPDSTGPVHHPLDIADHPDHIARRIFTDAEIEAHLDALERAQLPDGGWDTPLSTWTPTAHTERRAMTTVRNLLVLRAYGRLPRR